MLFGRRIHPFATNKAQIVIPNAYMVWYEISLVNAWTMWTIDNGKFCSHFVITKTLYDLSKAYVFMGVWQAPWSIFSMRITPHRQTTKSHTGSWGSRQKSIFYLHCKLGAKKTAHHCSLFKTHQNHYKIYSCMLPTLFSRRNQLESLHRRIKE